MLKNTEIREAIRKKRLRYYEIAEALGIAPETLSRKLRTELPPDKQEEILEIIENFEF